MTGDSQSICVIIAAKNASDTIATAIKSALAEPEVAEVVVIDDGSTDATATIAQSCDDETGRLKVERFDVNRVGHGLCQRRPAISGVHAEDGER
jgi:succinoglycan biosynthesis protein ExoU